MVQLGFFSFFSVDISKGPSARKHLKITFSFLARVFLYTETSFSSFSRIMGSGDYSPIPAPACCSPDNFTQPQQGSASVFIVSSMQYFWSLCLPDAQIYFWVHMQWVYWSGQEEKALTLPTYVSIMLCQTTVPLGPKRQRWQLLEQIAFHPTCQSHLPVSMQDRTELLANDRGAQGRTD